MACYVIYIYAWAAIQNYSNNAEKITNITVIASQFIPNSCILNNGETTKYDTI
jgi:hypothetical protein